MGQKQFNERVIAAFRAGGGKVGGELEDMTLLLLTTTGAETGRITTTPLTCVPDGNQYIVTASNDGASAHPAWYYNIRANPQVTVEFGTEEFTATATVPDRAERDRLFAMMIEHQPYLTEHQKRTDRVIPVVVLSRSVIA